MGFDTLNLITSIGAFVLAAGILLVLLNVIVSLKRGRLAGANPWDASSLEWAVPSPPPEYNFAVIPVVASRHPLWEDRLQESEDRSMINRGYLLAHGRETIGTTPLDGDPELILRMPQDSYSPLVLTLGNIARFCGASDSQLVGRLDRRDRHRAFDFSLAMAAPPHASTGPSGVMSDIAVHRVIAYRRHRSQRGRLVGSALPHRD